MRVEIYRRLNQANPELTIGSVKPKLESGDIFMAKVDGGGEQPGQIPEKKITQEIVPPQGRVGRARRALSSRAEPPRIAHALLDDPSEPIVPPVAPLSSPDIPVIPDEAPGVPEHGAPIPAAPEEGSIPEQIRLAWESAVPISDQASETERKVRDVIIEAAVLRGFSPVDQAETVRRLKSYLRTKQTGREAGFDEIPENEERITKEVLKEIIKVMTSGFSFTEEELDAYSGMIESLDTNAPDYVERAKKIIQVIHSKQEEYAIDEDTNLNEEQGEEGFYEESAEGRSQIEGEERVSLFDGVYRALDALEDAPDDATRESMERGIRRALATDLTVNGALIESSAVRPGEGVRLRNGRWVHPEDYERYRATWASITADPNLDSMRARAKKFINELEFKLDERGREVAGDRIQNVQDLAKFIVTKQNAEIYGVGKRFELVDSEGNFHPENFLIWLREQSIAIHNDNKNDQLSPLTSVVIETTFRTISIYMMTRFREQYFRDKKSGEVMHDLANRVLMEAFMFGVFRNSDIAYRSVMGEDKRLPEALPQIHSRNDLTSSDNWQYMLNAPAEFGTEHDMRVGEAVMFCNDFYYNISDKEELIKLLGDRPITRQDFEDALLLLSGKHEWERDQIKFDAHFDPEDPNGPFYLNDDKQRVYFFMDSNGQMQDTVNIDAFIDGLNTFNMATPKTSTVNLLREIVRVKAAQKYGLNDGIARGEKAEEKKRQYDEAVARHKVILRRITRDGQELSQAEIDRRAKDRANSEFKKEQSADRTNLEYAETTSWIFQRPYGIAARNDTLRRGFDAATKLYLYDYILRQSKEGTGGPIGIPEMMGIFRLLSPDLVEGLLTESGVSPRQLMLQIREVDLMPGGTPEQEAEKAKKKAEILSHLRFAERAEMDFTSNQQSRGFQIYHSFTEGDDLDLHDVITHSFWEGIKVKLSKAEEVVKDKWMKPVRYLLSSNNALNFAAKARMLDFVKTGKLKPAAAPEAIVQERNALNQQRVKEGKATLPQVAMPKPAPIYSTVTLAEKMLSPDVTDRDYISDDGKVIKIREALMDPAKYEQNRANVRKALAKNAITTRIAFVLKFHRELYGLGERWGYERVQALYHYLHRIREWEPVEGKPGRVKENPEKGFFSHHDLEWMRGLSNTKEYNMIMEELGKQGGVAALGAGKDALSAFIQAILK